MYALSAANEAALRSVFFTSWRCEYSNDLEQTWTPLDLYDGTATQDRTNQIRWTSSATVGGAELSLSGINPYTTRYRLFWGIRAVRGPWQWVPWGVYRVNSVDEDNDGVLAITGESKEAYIIDARFPFARTVPAQDRSTTYKGSLEQLIREVQPTAQFAWNANVAKAAAKPMTAITGQTDRWALVDGNDADPSIAKALAAEVYANDQGVYTVSLIPSMGTSPVWDIDEGDEGVKIGWKQSVSRESVYNVLVVTGEQQSETEDDSGNLVSAPPVVGYAWDNIPGSPTYAGKDPINKPGVALSAFGVVTRFYSSPFVTSGSQATQIAQRMIGNYLGLQRKVEVSAASHPGLRVGDVVRVQSRNGMLENQIVDTISADFKTSAMTLATRATSTRLLGYNSAELAEEDGFDG